MGVQPSKQLLEPATRISTGFECDSCYVTIDSIRWDRCKVCKMFDLCNTCTKYGYDNLLSLTKEYHTTLHHHLNMDKSITSEFMASVRVQDAEDDGKENRNQMLKRVLDNTMKEKKIRNDYHMHHVMTKLKQIEDESQLSSRYEVQAGSADELSSEPEKLQRSELNSMIAEYYMRGCATNIRVLSLDGGGVRGYMPIQILIELITEEYLNGIPHNYDEPDNQTKFLEAQEKFTDRFDYFVGTSTGGLIAFCMAVNYNIVNLRKLYENFHHYFKPNTLLPLPVFRDKYNPCNIHDEIDKIIGTIKLKDGTLLSPEHATLLDLHNFLNDDVITDDNFDKGVRFHGNLLEFADGDNTFPGTIKREKVLLITAYNATNSSITVFNTSYAPHWAYRIADVLKATMAAPVFFPSHLIYKGKKVNGQFVKEGNPEVYIDGGVFANDPELVALWAAQMQWKKPVTYNVLSIGTGIYTAPISQSSRGGYLKWLSDGGLVVNTLMDATRSLTETIVGNLAKFDNIKRIKFNYNLLQSMSLDDGNFVQQFNEEWKKLKTGDDYAALLYFYKKYLKAKQS